MQTIQIGVMQGETDLQAGPTQIQRGAVKQISEGFWLVRSQRIPSMGYHVVKGEWGIRCNCPDFQFRQRPCKHILIIGADF